MCFVWRFHMYIEMVYIQMVMSVFSRVFNTVSFTLSLSLYTRYLFWECTYSCESCCGDGIGLQMAVIIVCIHYQDQKIQIQTDTNWQTWCSTLLMNKGAIKRSLRDAIESPLCVSVKKLVSEVRVLRVLLLGLFVCFCRWFLLHPKYV